MGISERLREETERVALEVRALYLACRDPRVPWYARALAGCVVAYAFSPIDLIPDFIPVIGHLDDAILIPLGVVLLRRLIPEAVMAECRARAASAQPSDGRLRRTGLVLVVGLWLLLASAGIVLVLRLV